MPGSLRAVLFGIAGATLSITSALSQEQPKHPAEPASSTTQPSTNAMELAVPLLSREAVHPSYGPAPSGAAPDPAAEMDGMMEMDHSAHQMPESEMPESDMPGTDHGAMPEDAE